MTPKCGSLAIIEEPLAVLPAEIAMELLPDLLKNQDDKDVIAGYTTVAY